MLKQIFESAELKDRSIEIDGKDYAVVKGKHSVVVPDKKMKIVWSYNGKIESLTDWDKGRHADVIKNHTFNFDKTGFDEVSIESLLNEHKIFEELAAAGMAPKPDGFFYIKTMVSASLYGARHADPKGVYGFFLENADKMPGKGRFSLDAFKREFVDTGKIEASDIAFKELVKKENVRNGYLIHFRRSFKDTMRWKGDVRAGEFSLYRQDRAETVDRIQRLSQFPHKERKQNYQTFYMDGQYHEGTRQTTYRYDTMGIEKDLSGKTVVDLGCNLGSMCCEAYLRGARQITGVDYEKDYVDCARDLVRYNGFQINYLQMDLMKTKDCIQHFRAYYKKPIDVIFTLSIYKHIKNAMWELLEGIPWKVCYLESHNAPEGLETGHVKEMTAYLAGQKDWDSEFLGQVDDRSPRCLWRLVNRKYAAEPAKVLTHGA